MCLDNRKDRGRARFYRVFRKPERPPERFLEPAASAKFEGASSKNTWSDFPDAIQQTLPSQQYRACFINTGTSNVTQKTVRIFLHHWRKNWDGKMTLYPYICDEYLWLSYIPFEAVSQIHQQDFQMVIYFMFSSFLQQSTLVCGDVWLFIHTLLTCFSISKYILVF